jgi:hypothetical protein
MPASRRSLDLQENYRRELKKLWRKVVALVEDRYRQIDPDDLSRSFREFVPAAATLVGMGQQQAIILADAFLTAYVGAEKQTTVELAAEPIPPATTFDGRRLEEALAATPVKVFLALKAGRPVADALAFGRFSAARFAHTEVVDASRQELKVQIEAAEEVRGWRWSAQGSACGACLAADNGAIRSPSTTLIGHAGCDCVMEPVVAGVKERVQRLSGQEKFHALPVAEQNKRLGEEKAELVRSGAVPFSDLIKTERHEEWRPSITEQPLEELKT